MKRNLFYSNLQIIFLIILSSCAFAVKNEHFLLDAAKSLPLKGELKFNKRGYLYLDVTNRYIDELYPLIRDKGFNIPNHYLRPTTIGAHISVMYEFETKRIPLIKEIGKNFSFELKSIKVVENNKKKFFVLQVKSDELERLRKKYKLKSKLAGHEFHITIAEKWKYN